MLLGESVSELNIMTSTQFLCATSAMVADWRSFFYQAYVPADERNVSFPVGIVQVIICKLCYELKRLMRYLVSSSGRTAATLFWTARRRCACSKACCSTRRAIRSMRSPTSSPPQPTTSLTIPPQETGSGRLFFICCIPHVYYMLINKFKVLVCCFLIFRAYFEIKLLH